MKVYMAGPLFTMGERAINEIVASILRELGHEVYLPQEVEGERHSHAAIFQAHMAGLDRAEVIVACVDGADADSGTCWELGYAYAKGKQSLIYRTDFRYGNEVVNLMMTESVPDLIFDPEANAVELACKIDYWIRRRYIERNRTKV